MKMCLCLLLTFVGLGSYTQNNFRSTYEKKDPTTKMNDLSIDQKIGIHQIFLEESIKKNEVNSIFLGYSYLISDYMRLEDFVRVNVLINKADSIANLYLNKVWQGHVLHRKAILALRLRNLDESIKYYSESLSFFKEAKDTTSLAETYEQLSVLFGEMNDYVTSDSLYEIAIGMIKSLKSQKHIAATYNNRANIIVKRDLFADAIPLYQQSIQIYKNLGMTKEMSKAMNNLGSAFINTGRLVEANEIIDECIELNKKERIFENLYINYNNKSEILNLQGKYKDSKYFLTLYYELKDSLIGSSVQTKIKEMDRINEVQKNKNLLAETEIALLKTQNKFTKLAIVFLLLTIVLGFTIIVLNKKLKNIKGGLFKSKEEINVLTHKNKEKDLLISDLEMTVVKFKGMIHFTSDEQMATKEHHFYEPILTNHDWMAFKIYFENKYPGFISNIRSKFSNLSNAEERLLLLIKLNLDTKEIAAILAIAQDSVKKTRSRLRKKLNLEQDTELDNFIFEIN